MVDTHTPGFICVGGAKCGTTSLYEYLRQHPQIFLPDQKELHYFSYPELIMRPEGPGMRAVLNGLCKSEDEYRKHFKHAAVDQLCGDISPSYLIERPAITRIKELLGSPKIIIMLRDPVDRVFSQYMHLRRAAREDLSFEDALNAESDRISANWGDMWHYARSGFYADHVAAYLDAFGSENVLVLLSKDVHADPQAEMIRVFRFLGVNPSVPVDTAEEFNRSGLPKSLLIARLTDASKLANLAKKILPRRLGTKLKRWLQNLNTGEKGDLNTDTKNQLMALYTDDIKKLEALIGRSTGWGCSGMDKNG